MKLRLSYDRDDLLRLIQADLQAQGYAVSDVTVEVPEGLEIPVIAESTRRAAAPPPPVMYRNLSTYQVPPPVAPPAPVPATPPMTEEEARNFLDQLEEDDQFRAKSSEQVKREHEEYNRRAQALWTPQSVDENLFTSARGVQDPYRELPVGPPTVDVLVERPRRVREIK